MVELGLNAINGVQRNGRGSGGNGRLMRRDWRAGVVEHSNRVGLVREQAKRGSGVLGFSMDGGRREGDGLAGGGRRLDTRAH